MTGWLWIAMAACVALAAPARADITCDDTHGKVCIETVQTNGSVIFYAENRHRLLPVTLDIGLTLDNLRRSDGSDTPYVLEGGARTRLFTLTTIRNAAWSYRYRFSWSRGDLRARHDAGVLYRLPFAGGATFRVGQGCDGTFTHRGAQNFAVDFNMPEGTPIHAARAGRVVDLKEDSRRGGADAAYRNDGNYVIVAHADGTLAQYFHLRRDGVAVELGQSVRRGQLLGHSGSTGQATGPHLHFDVIRGAVGIESETLPIRFDTTSGPVTCPVPGTRLTAVE